MYSFLFILNFKYCMYFFCNVYGGRWWRSQSRQSAKPFLQSSELAELGLPPWFKGGDALACGRGVGGVPIQTGGRTLRVVLCIYNYVLCGGDSLQ
jgi:hypothetical protein